MVITELNLTYNQFSDYPNDVLDDMVSKYNTRVVVYDITGVDMWQGEYTDGFLMKNTIFLPRSRLDKVKDAEVYFAKRFTELMDFHHEGTILKEVLPEHKDRASEIYDMRLKAVGFLANPKHRFYLDIEEILGEDTMHFILKRTLAANPNVGVHYLDLYADASKYIERRRRWRSFLGIGKKVSDKLEKQGIIKKNTWSNWAKIVRSNPLFDKWMLLMLGSIGGATGLTAIAKKMKKKAEDATNAVKEKVTGKPTETKSEEVKSSEPTKTESSESK